MATEKKAAAKARPAKVTPADGICRHRSDGKYDCKLPSRVATETRKAGSWCDKHVIAGRAAAKKSAPKAKAPKLTVVKPVVARKAPPAPARVAHPRVPAQARIAALVTLAPTDDPS